MKANQILVQILLLIVVCGTVVAQDTVDVITKLNGEEMKGKVLSIDEATITFVYAGEQLEYKIDKSEINKILFASGRTQVFNEVGAPASVAAPANSVSNVPSAADRRGKIAVLPFEFSTNDGSVQGENLDSRAQMECARSLRDNTNNIVVQDPRTTNALLAKNNIDASSIATMLPADLAVLLGVEYVLFGTLNVENKGTLTTGSEVTTYKDKNKSESERGKYERKSSGTEVSSGNSSTSITYDVRIGLSLYNDQGKSVYSDSREPFGSGVESYISGMDYMIKRMPFGTKNK